MNRFKLKGTDEQLGNFWSVSLAFANSMPMYESLFTSSWPLAGNRKWGMCIIVNDKVKNSTGSLRAIAKACGVEMSELTATDERMADELRKAETELSGLKKGCDAERMTEAFRRVIDYECSGLKYWMNQCLPINDFKTWEKYQSAYNHLVNVRNRMTSAGWALSYLEAKGEVPEATMQVFK